MAKQRLVWTVLPNGYLLSDGTGTTLKFSVLLSPRLISSDPAPTLAEFPDFAGPPPPPNINLPPGPRPWPTTIQGLGFELFLRDIDGGITLPAVQDPGTAATANAVQWNALFPTTTPVTPYGQTQDQKGYDHRRLRSFPVGNIADFLATRYGQFGLNTPTEFPAYGDLVQSTAFGPIGFEGGADDAGGNGDGPTRKKELIAGLESDFDIGPGSTPADWAIPYDPNALASVDSMGRAFLQLEQFLKRDLVPAPEGPFTPRPPVPQFDFHQAVALTQGLPTLQRMLGLVVDLTVDASGLFANGGSFQSAVQLVVDGFEPQLTDTQSCFPFTHAFLAPGNFRPVPLDPNNTDYAVRQLRLGDPTLFRIVRVDPDGNGIKARQFADNVTRSRHNGEPRSDFTPEGYAPPGLRTGGFALARSGRAGQMAETLDRQTTLQNDTFDANGDLTGAPPEFYEEDLIRGHRIDVFHEADGKWRSLMWRAGTYDLLNLGDDGVVPVVEEDTVVVSPTTASRSASDPGDLYLQETLTRWGGWSLAVPRIGSPMQDNDSPTSTDPSPAGFAFSTSWHVPGDDVADGNSQKVPRLRFDQIYQFRARGVDHAGNSLLVDHAATEGVAISPPLRHVRFEPVAAPRLLLTAPHTPGESSEVLVIRSEDADDFGTDPIDNGTATRFLVPPRSSQLLAEQHHAFDNLLDSADGFPMKSGLDTYNDIVARDRARLGDLPATPEDHPAGSFYYPSVDHLPVAYLPDVLGSRASVRGLPPSTADGTQLTTLPFDTAGVGWPQFQACRVVLQRGDPDWKTSTFTAADGTTQTTELDVFLDKGDILTTRMSCALTQDEAGAMGVWEWIQSYAAAQSPPVDTTAVLTAIENGAHWAITPWRVVRFVHAVRTPLFPPQLLDFAPVKTSIGQTFATFPGGTVLMSRKSTAQIDVDGTWEMPIDTGSNEDPVTPQSFKAHAFGITIDRNGGEQKDVNFEPVTEIHQFNDTKFRSVTYQATATSSFVEYFREEEVISLTLGPLVVGTPFEGTTVEIFDSSTLAGGDYLKARKLVPAPPGTDPAADPAPGDYVVDDVAGTIQLLAHGTEAIAHGVSASSPVSVVFSYVAPDIHSLSDPTHDHTADMVVPNSARPSAPKVLYVLPVYTRNQTAKTTSVNVNRMGRSLRVYLDRPWWSSGDGERLGVVCWHQTPNQPSDPPAALVPYVTQWGFDPVFKSTTRLPAQPSPANFRLATASDSTGTLSIEEVNGLDVDVAGHDVGYDPDRELWYCDIEVTDNKGKELTSYTPFIRLALARYQPNSIPDTHLSRVVLADFAQLAPDRSVTVLGTDPSFRTVTVVGRAPVSTFSSTVPSDIQVTVEQRDPRIPDEELAWSTASGPKGFHATTVLTPKVSDGDLVTWTAGVAIPAGNRHPLRLMFEEYERLQGDDSTSQGAPQFRLAYTETVPVIAHSSSF